MKEEDILALTEFALFPKEQAVLEKKENIIAFLNGYEFLKKEKLLSKDFRAFLDQKHHISTYIGNWPKQIETYCQEKDKDWVQAFQELLLGFLLEKSIGSSNYQLIEDLFKQFYTQKNISPLPKGVTGFSSAGEPLLPSTSVSEIDTFIRKCGKVKGVEFIRKTNPHQSANFYGLEFEIYSNKVFLLINETHPILCASNTLGWMQQEFVEVPTLFLPLLSKFEIFTPEVLNTPTNQEILKNLGTAEIKQINYWGSKTIGEIIFNGYD